MILRQLHFGKRGGYYIKVKGKRKYLKFGNDEAPLQWKQTSPRTANRRGRRRVQFVNLDAGGNPIDIIDIPSEGLGQPTPSPYGPRRATGRRYSVIPQFHRSVLERASARRRGGTAYSPQVAKSQAEVLHQELEEERLIQEQQNMARQVVSEGRAEVVDIQTHMLYGIQNMIGIATHTLHDNNIIAHLLNLQNTATDKFNNLLFVLDNMYLNQSRADITTEIKRIVSFFLDDVKANYISATNYMRNFN